MRAQQLGVALVGAAAVLVGQGQTVEEAVVHATLFEALVTKGIGDAAIEGDEIKVLADALRGVSPGRFVVECFKARFAKSMGRH